MKRPVSVACQYVKRVTSVELCVTFTLVYLGLSSIKPCKPPPPPRSGRPGSLVYAQGRAFSCVLVVCVSGAVLRIGRVVFDVDQTTGQRVPQEELTGPGGRVLVHGGRRRHPSVQPHPDGHGGVFHHLLADRGVPHLVAAVDVETALGHLHRPSAGPGAQRPLSA